MCAAKKITNTMDAFTAYLRECNMRLTSERMAVVEIISKHNDLFCVNDLHSEVERQAFPVSLATVYNTVEVMVDAGLLKCVKLNDRPDNLYKLSQPERSHVYFICDQCGKVREASASDLVRFINKYDFRSFTPRAFSLNIHGLCRKCSKIGKAPDSGK